MEKIEPPWRKKRKYSDRDLFGQEYSLFLTMSVQNLGKWIHSNVSVKKIAIKFSKRRGVKGFLNVQKNCSIGIVGHPLPRVCKSWQTDPIMCCSLWSWCIVFWAKTWRTDFHNHTNTNITNITNIHSHTQTLTYTDTLRHTNNSWQSWESWCSVAWGKKFGHRRSETDKSCPVRVRVCTQRTPLYLRSQTNKVGVN